MEERIRILAVDDNSINLATIEQELKGIYEVITVNSGSRAIRFLKKEKPDLILLDVQMALMDGIETLREIRALENGAAVPVIMLTARKDKETVIEGRKLGIMDYVLKPFGSQDLHTRIVRALKKAGVLPMDEREIYEIVKDVEKDLVNKNSKSAAAKIEEVLSYRIEEGISGRLQNARARLNGGDEGTALRLVDRVLKILEKNVALEPQLKPAISPDEMNEKLFCVLTDLENFKIREANQKLEELLRYDLPQKIHNVCIAAQGHLDEYDDGAAEELINGALNLMKSDPSERRHVTGEEEGTESDGEFCQL